MAKIKNLTAINKLTLFNITKVAVLEEGIWNIWIEIDVNFIKNLYNSVQKRIQTVIKMKGNITK